MKPEALVAPINAAIGIKMKASRIAAAARVAACQARFRRLKGGLTGGPYRLRRAVVVGGRKPNSASTFRPAGEVTSSIHSAANLGCGAAFTAAIGYSAKTFSSAGMAIEVALLPALLTSVR